MVKKSALGSVLDSIFDDSADILSADGGENKVIITLKLSDIEPNREQPRKDFDQEGLNRLASSIAEHGVIQPLTVRPLGDVYQIVAGERRWRAARIAGLSEVPVRIMELSDLETMQIALIENLQREDLNPIEEAAGYQELIDRFGMKQEDVAKQVGRARSSVANALRLLTLPEKIRDLVRSGELSKGHSKALMACADEKSMLELAEKSLRGALSVRSLEKQIKNANDKNEKTAPANANAKKKSVFVAEAEISLQNSIGKPVRITEGKNKITLEIDFADEEELREAMKEIRIN